MLSVLLMVTYADLAHFFIFSTVSVQMPPMQDQVRAKLEWDPKKGFTIPYITKYDFYSLLTCSTTVRGTKYTSLYIIVRLSKCLGCYHLQRHKQGHWIEYCRTIMLCGKIFYLPNINKWHPVIGAWDLCNVLDNSVLFLHL